MNAGSRASSEKQINPNLGNTLGDENNLKFYKNQLHRHGKYYISDKKLREYVNVDKEREDEDH